MVELNGKPVNCAVGTTPLDAWGNALVRLGLIDEIMLETAIEAVQKSRDDAFQEARDKLAGRKTSTTPPKGRVGGGAGETKTQNEDAALAPLASAASSAAPSPVQSVVNSDDGSVQQPEALVEATVAEEENDKEPPSEKELKLKKEVESLMAELELAEEADRQASIALANSRINSMGRFLCNPFNDDATGKAQQASWLATAVRKEKTRMGSTGNRKKIVTAMDLLERNDSLYNTDIEALIEGLPGSEYCKSYVFQAFRSGGVNRTWIHEALLRHEKEAVKRQKRSREAREKEAAKENMEMERVRKRQKKEKIRDLRKRQKLEEEEEKKRARAEERLSRLRIQVKERLFAEATAQREKVVTTLARSLGKEFARRRKASELVAAQVVVESKEESTGIQMLNSNIDLPSISKLYDEDTVRVWNFMTTFSSFFTKTGYVTEIPSLDSLQTAIDCVRGRELKSTISRDDAVSSLTDLSVALCKPLAASLTRVLFASLIALNPVLQKDFGAAFFNEVNAINPSKEDEVNSRPDVLLPVNSMTWQEIARLAFLSDAFMELGYSRHEAAHVLRGYRSAGHPNSKEARRLRRVEEFPVGLLRQAISQSHLKVSELRNSGNLTRAIVPCTPMSYPDEFCFYLHNIVTLQNVTATALKQNLADAIRLIREMEEEGSKKHLHKMERLQSMLEEASEWDHPAKAEAKALKKAQDGILQIFNQVSGLASDKFAEDASNGGVDHVWPWTDLTRRSSDPGRGQMGLLNTLVMTQSGYKFLNHTREKYMEDALRLKEELEREKRKEEEDEDEDDDDDDDDDDGNAVSATVVVENESKIADGAKMTEVVEKAVDNSKISMPAGRDSAQTGENDTAETKTVSTEMGGAISAAAKNPASSSKPDSEVETKADRIGKETPYDDFCADIPKAPEMIRRCLAVLRTLSQTGSAEPFLYPVDPQTNPAYYDSLIRPMCLREVGVQLQKAANAANGAINRAESSEKKVEAVVADFGRNVRLIGKNCLSYANAGPTVVSAGAEMLRIFERLLLDWILAPESELPSLDELDDDRCIHHHPSDAESTVLLCDGCEGKYNIARLDPPLYDIPKGDWYCPRCVNGRWWGDLDPRVGRTVKDFVSTEDPALLSNDSSFSNAYESTGVDGRIEKCMLHYPEGAHSKPSLCYLVRFEDEREETWPLEKVDLAIKLNGEDIAPIRCLEAVAESLGYGFGVDNGYREDLVPIPANPNVSDTAAQVALSSSVFRDTITAAGTLLVIDPRDMTSSEWLRLLVLLIMKCASSDVFQTIISDMETKAAERMAVPLEKLNKVSDILEVLPAIDECGPPGEEDMEVEEADKGEAEDKKAGDSNDREVLPSAAPSSDLPAVVVEASAVEVMDDMEVDEPERNASSADVIAQAESKEVQFDQPKPYAEALVEKKRRQKMAEDSFAAYSLKNHVRSTVASFEEDNVTQVIDAMLSSKDSPLEFSSLRCRRTVCAFCGLTDVALGLPLIRVPTEKEWDDLIPHAARSRRTHLVAEIPTDLFSALSSDSDVRSDESGTEMQLVPVKVRVNDEIVSVEGDWDDSIVDGGMLEFVPRSRTGMQDELRFRDEVDLPFIIGSLSAHECCAVSAHKARKDQMVQRHKERQAEILEKEFGMDCGRTLEIGRDGNGRSYWKLYSDTNALFVCMESSHNAPVWHRFPDAASVASVIVSLGKDSIAKNLQQAFPDAFKLVRDGTWSNDLLKKRFPKAVAVMKGKITDGDSDEEEEVSTLTVEGGFDVSCLEVLIQVSLGSSYLGVGQIRTIMQCCLTLVFRSIPQSHSTSTRRFW